MEDGGSADQTALGGADLILWRRRPTWTRLLVGPGPSMSGRRCQPSIWLPSRPFPRSPRTAAAPLTADHAVTASASASRARADRQAIVAAADPGAELGEDATVGGLVAVRANGRRIDVEEAVAAHDDARLGGGERGAGHVWCPIPSSTADRRETGARCLRRGPTIDPWGDSVKREPSVHRGDSSTDAPR